MAQLAFGWSSLRLSDTDCDFRILIGFDFEIPPHHPEQDTFPSHRFFELRIGLVLPAFSREPGNPSTVPA
jgi:hypothetical protein